VTVPELSTPMGTAAAEAAPLRRRRSAGDPLVRWLAGIAVALALVVVVLPLAVTTSPTAVDSAAMLQPPSADHPLGTDQVGRDVAARVLEGARLSLLVAVASALAALLAGGVLGALAAAGPRRLGGAIMRLMDVGLAFPGILLAIVMAAAIGPSVTTTIIVLAVIYTPSMARVVRAAIFDELGEDYVTAARLLGSSRIRIVGFHIGINAASPVLVYTTLIMSDAIVAEAALSFLGAGIRPPEPSWGNIIRDGQAVVGAGAWWVSLFPGLLIVGTVLAINRFAEIAGRRARSR
jgi:ABC-type dipeptide/oligopeptide/nickel transport system permease subunit